jgi:hypothetical protein
MVKNTKNLFFIQTFFLIFVGEIVRFFHSLTLAVIILNHRKKREN